MRRLPKNCVSNINCTALPLAYATDALPNTNVNIRPAGHENESDPNIETPATPSFMGSAHQINPMGASSPKYSAENRTLRHLFLFLKFHFVQIGPSIMPIENIPALAMPLQQFQVNIIDDNGFNVGSAFSNDCIAREGNI